MSHRTRTVCNWAMAITVNALALTCYLALMGGA